MTETSADDAWFIAVLLFAPLFAPLMTPSPAAVRPDSLVPHTSSHCASAMPVRATSSTCSSSLRAAPRRSLHQPSGRAPMTFAASMMIVRRAARSPRRRGQADPNPGCKGNEATSLAGTQRSSCDSASSACASKRRRARAITVV